MRSFRPSTQVVGPCRARPGPPGFGTTPTKVADKLGWFVGWAQRDDRRIVFAQLVVDTKRSDTPKDPKTRAMFLKELPNLIK